MNATAHPLVDDYLRRLHDAARDLPRQERGELVDAIRQHLDEALTTQSTEADVRNVLDSLGSPTEIVAAAGQPPATRKRGAREVFALVLLVTGLPPVIGWLVGVGLLLWSPLWTGRQKVLGMLVWPGGWMSLLFFLSASTSSSVTLCQSQGLSSKGHVLPPTCTSAGSTGPGWWVAPVLILAFLAPVVVAGYLYRAAGQRAGD